MEIHLRAGDHGLRVGEPAIERLFIPYNMRVLERIRVIRVTYVVRDSRHMRPPWEVLIEGMTSAAVLFKLIGRETLPLQKFHCSASHHEMSRSMSHDPGHDGF